MKDDQEIGEFQKKFIKGIEVRLLTSSPAKIEGIPGRSKKPRVAVFW